MSWEKELGMENAPRWVKGTLISGIGAVCGALAGLTLGAGADMISALDDNPLVIAAEYESRTEIAAEQRQQNADPKNGSFFGLVAGGLAGVYVSRTVTGQNEPVTQKQPKLKLPPPPNHGPYERKRRF